MADGDSPGKDSGGGWVPVPDPTLRTREDLLREIGNLQKVLSARMDAMDEATGLRMDALLKVPDEIAEQIAHLHDLMDEKFKSIDVRFQERDKALEAAFQSAKELVGVTNDNVTKQIDQIASSSAAQNQATDARITDLKERIDRGGGIGEGAQVQRTETRQQSAGVIAAIGLGFTLVIAVISIVGLILANR
jgi:hypothetical protein